MNTISIGKNFLEVKVKLGVIAIECESAIISFVKSKGNRFIVPSDFRHLTEKNGYMLHSLVFDGHELAVIYVDNEGKKKFFTSRELYMGDSQTDFIDIFLFLDYFEFDNDYFEK